MDIKDIAWAAGIYEGEGCFAGNPDKGSRFVHVVQKDPWLCHRLKSLFGGTIRVDNGYHRWMLCGDSARGFLLTIFTFLSPRRRKVILEGKHFFRKYRCGNDLHDYIPSNIGRELSSRSGMVSYCIPCRRVNRHRNSAARKASRRTYDKPKPISQGNREFSPDLSLSDFDIFN